jgi:hypothetical protein
LSPSAPADAFFICAAKSLRGAAGFLTPIEPGGASAAVEPDPGARQTTRRLSRAAEPRRWHVRKPSKELTGSATPCPPATEQAGRPRAPSPLSLRVSASAGPSFAHPIELPIEIPIRGQKIPQTLRDSLTLESAIPSIRPTRCLATPNLSGICPPPPPPFSHGIAGRSVKGRSAPASNRIRALATPGAVGHGALIRSMRRRFASNTTARATGSAG